MTNIRKTEMLLNKIEKEVVDNNPLDIENNILSISIYGLLTIYGEDKLKDLINVIKSLKEEDLITLSKLQNSFDKLKECINILNDKLIKNLNPTILDLKLIYHVIKNLITEDIIKRILKLKETNITTCNINEILENIDINDYHSISYINETNLFRPLYEIIDYQKFIINSIINNKTNKIIEDFNSSSNNSFELLCKTYNNLSNKLLENNIEASYSIAKDACTIREIISNYKKKKYLSNR